MREFKKEELSEFDGKEGRPAYIVHNGNVYDVSASKLWKGGHHMRRHQAGTDLSVDIGGAPHGVEVLERYPQIGTVAREKSAAAQRIPEFLTVLFARFPMLQRHPHPMTVHFPIVFMLAAPFFSLLHLATGAGSFDTTAFHCLGGGLLFTPIVMLTGIFTWWLNYMAKPVRPVIIKLTASLALLGVSLLAFTWRATVPGILDSPGLPGAVYLLLILSLAPLVIVIGWFGAKLTFPVERE